MKGYTKDHKFIPISDYKKVTRKSRTENKTGGVRLQRESTKPTKKIEKRATKELATEYVNLRNELTRISTPLNLSMDFWRDLKNESRRFADLIERERLDKEVSTGVPEDFLEGLRKKRARVTGVPSGIIVKEGIAISSTIVNERTAKLVDEGSKIFRDRNDLAGAINTDVERINTLLTSKPRSEKLDSEQIKTLERFSSAIEGASERLENKFGALFASKDAEKIDDELDNIDTDIDNFVSDNFSNKRWHEDVQKLRDIKKEVKRQLRVVMIQSGSLRDEVRRLKERDSDFNRKATLGSNRQIRKSLDQAQIELLNLSSTTRDIDKRFQQSFRGS